MRLPIPQTIASEVMQTLQRYVVDAPRFVERTDLRVKRLEADVAKLLKVDAVQGYVAQAGIAQLRGDAEQVRVSLDCAARLSSDPWIDHARAQFLLNLGYFSEAQAAFAAAADPRRGGFSRYIEIGLFCAAVESMQLLAVRADKLDIDTALPCLEKAAQIREVFSLTGLDEALASRMLDVAGDLMREGGLFFVGEEPAIRVINDVHLGQCVYYTWPLSVTADRAVDMQMELADRLIERFPELPGGLSIGFRAVS